MCLGGGGAEAVSLWHTCKEFGAARPSPHFLPLTVHILFSGCAICWKRAFVLPYLCLISALCQGRGLSLQAVRIARLSSSHFSALTKHFCCSSPPISSSISGFSHPFKIQAFLDWLQGYSLLKGNERATFYVPLKATDCILSIRQNSFPLRLTIKLHTVKWFSIFSTCCWIMGLQVPKRADKWCSCH